MSDRSVFLMILSLACFWLVLDEFYGKHYVSNFIGALLPG
mgnify:CR=1 FL=1